MSLFNLSQSKCISYCSYHSDLFNNLLVVLLFFPRQRWTDKLLLKLHCWIFTRNLQSCLKYITHILNVFLANVSFHVMPQRCWTLKERSSSHLYLISSHCFRGDTVKGICRWEADFPLLFINLFCIIDWSICSNTHYVSHGPVVSFAMHTIVFYRHLYNGALRLTLSSVTKELNWTAICHIVPLLSTYVSLRDNYSEHMVPLMVLL